MTTDDIIKLFRELGFPAAVAAFVLWRVEARLTEIRDSLLRLHELVRALAQPPA